MIDFANIPYIPAAHQSARQPGSKITDIVMHTMSGSYEGSIEWFKDPKSAGSAHYLISQKGEVTQCVKDIQKAWAVCNFNSQSISIEMEDGVPGAAQKSISWLTPALWDKAVELTAALCIKYGINPLTNIWQHCDPYLRKFGNDHVDISWNLWPAIKFKQAVQSAIQQEKSSA